MKEYNTIKEDYNSDQDRPMAKSNDVLKDIHPCHSNSISKEKFSLCNDGIYAQNMKSLRDKDTLSIRDTAVDVTSAKDIRDAETANGIDKTYFQDDVTACTEAKYPQTEI